MKASVGPLCPQHARTPGLEVPVSASGVITGGDAVDAVDAAIGDGPLSVGDAALFCGCVWRVGVCSDPGYARK